MQACQLLCFPFALDVDEDTIALVIEAVRDSQIPPQLLQVHFYPHLCLPLHKLETIPHIAAHVGTAVCTQLETTLECHTALSARMMPSALLCLLSP